MEMDYKNFIEKTLADILEERGYQFQSALKQQLKIVSYINRSCPYQEAEVQAKLKMLECILKERLYFLKYDKTSVAPLTLISLIKNYYSEEEDLIAVTEFIVKTDNLTSFEVSKEDYTEILHILDGVSSSQLWDFYKKAKFKPVQINTVIDMKVPQISYE